jgi:glutamyl-tRNA reductase
MVEYVSIDRVGRSSEPADIEAQEAQFGLLTEKHLLQQTGIAPGVPYVFLQTCNRKELYFGTGDVAPETARHLFRVVTGLESAITGEQAVQGQVKEAYYSAKELRPLSAEMHKMFQWALQVGKRVRHTTEISHGAVSHSLAALEILDALHTDWKHTRITLIGVNKLTTDILKFLQNKGAGLLFLANRSREKAEALAAPMGIGVYSLEEKQTFLAESDVVISATSAPHLIIYKGDVPEEKHLVAIDLAFPRDIDAALGELPGVQLFNIADVEQRVRGNLEVRQQEVKRAEEIIEEEIVHLMQELERRKRFVG